MPALIFLNRKWLVACDDLVIPCSMEAVLRVVWLVAASAIIWLKNDNCLDSVLGNYFMYAIFGDLIGTSFLSIALAITSSRGSVLEKEKRKFVAKLLYLKLLMVFIDCALASYGVWLFVYMESFCTQKEHFIKITTIGIWIYILIFATCVFICYSSLGSSKYWKSESDLNANFFQKAERVWKLRLKYFCCCADVPEREDSIFADVSRFLSSFLIDIDLAPTDILAGLITLDLKHAIERRRQNISGISLHKNELIANRTAPEWMTPENALYFLRLAKSTYGWLAFFDAFRPWNICTLSSPSKCCMQDSAIVIDNCCQCNAVAVQKITGFSDSDILYASFRNSAEEPAFYIAVDHQTKYIIVAICGSRSFSDLLTVINGEEQDFPLKDSPSNYKCHRGVLSSALFLQKKLNDLNVLNVAVAENPSYNIGITGHSLGGSIAAVLGLILHPQYPKLQCFVFAPLAVLTAGVVPDTLDFVFTVVVGDDIVPRLCANSCKELRMEIIKSLEETKIPKYKIITSAFWQYLKKFFKASAKKVVTEIYENKECEIDEENPYVQTTSQAISSDSHLYAPGRILYFEKGNRWKSHWLTGFDINNIFISRAIFEHHQPHKIQNMLEMYIKGQID
ncbi:sn1-specific diacylglycerol lipase alpha-like isoform X1 [Stegodyphus dumicola]|uniref:sn1-specific diacylglycerol lipase alpha-like isoform X1 n=1 Tax=Stegodyphus dumicola TaxID=202533 RepID=UPI0015AD7F84|nr:sn1-specific diacylglycerol lipase alpha-like isoform X1 [Stegodyphus dumicola]